MFACLPVDRLQKFHSLMKKNYIKKNTVKCRLVNVFERTGQQIWVSKEFQILKNKVAFGVCF